MSPGTALHSETFPEFSYFFSGVYFSKYICSDLSRQLVSEINEDVRKKKESQITQIPEIFFCFSLFQSYRLVAKYAI